MKETKNIKVIWPNNKETFVSDGDDWFSSAEKAGLEIPTGCLTGSCGACEIDVNGETVRACISEIKKLIQKRELYLSEINLRRVSDLYNLLVKGINYLQYFLLFLFPK